VFLVPALLGSGSAQPGALASASPDASQRAGPTRAPQRTFDASPSPSVAPEPEIRVYTVRPGNTLSAIADRFDVSMRHIQCLNVITNPNLLQPGQKLLIPPEGFSCPSGWRDMTPPPVP
jgi:LysM repeat protein